MSHCRYIMLRDVTCRIVVITGGTGLAGGIALADMNDGRKLAICVYYYRWDWFGWGYCLSRHE